MKMIMNLILCVLLVGSIVQAADWPSFRGDDQQSGKSVEAGLLKQWPEGGPELLWSVEKEFGAGWASCAIVDDIVYTVGMNDKTQNGAIYAIADGGSILWKNEYGKEWQKAFKGARTTPAVVGDKVYIISGQQVAFCFDKQTGNTIWQVDVKNNYKVKDPMFGFSESPLVVDGKVICSAGGELASVVALDAATGKEVWKSEALDTDCAYAAASYIDHNGLKMVIVMLGKMAAGLELKTGKILWTLAYKDYETEGDDRGRDIRANTPIYVDGTLFFTSGYNCGALIAKLGQDGKSIKFEKYIPEFDNHHHGVIYCDGYIYGTNWDGNNKGRWMCYDLKRQEIKYETDWDLEKSAIIFADGYCYCYQEKSGKVCLVKLNPEKLDVVSEFKVNQGGGQHWAHPSISNGKLYIRHGDSLMVYKIK